MKKSLVENSIYNIVYKVITALYPLVAVTYVSHILQSEKMGMVSYAQNIVSYFAVLAALGLPAYGIREIARKADNIEERSQIFGELLFINCISTSISIIAYIILVALVPKFSINRALYLIAGLQIFLNYINVDWFFQGLEEYKYISIRSIIVKLFALILLPILIHTPDDYLYYALVYCLAIAGNNIFNIIRVRNYVRITRINIKKLKRHIKPVFTLLIASIAVEIYAMIDTTMLGFYCNDRIVGCYSNAMKFTRMVNTTAAAIGAVLLPRLSRLFEENGKEEFVKLVNIGIKVMLMIAIPSMVGMILLSKEIIYVFFGHTFTDAIPILSILALMVPIVVCNTILGGQVLVTANLEDKYVISVVIASIVNVVLNALFIPVYGPVSAAIASLLSEFIDLIMYLWFARKIVRIRLSLNFVISTLIPIGIYVIVSKTFLMNFSSNQVLVIVFNIIFCAFIYFGLGMLMKNEAMKLTYSKLLGLLKKKQI